MDLGAGGGGSVLPRRRLLRFGLVPLVVGCLVLVRAPGTTVSRPTQRLCRRRSRRRRARLRQRWHLRPRRRRRRSPSPRRRRSTQPPSSSVDLESVALPQWGGAGCPQSGSALTQSVTGRFSQCLQVGGVPSGGYAIVLEQVLSSPTDVAPASPSMPGLKVTASPAAGPPGTTVTITGTLPVALSPRPDDVSLCWDGCPGGLSYPAETLRWLSSTTFQTTMVVPQAPWVNASPPRVVPLASGTYSIGVQCLQEAPRVRSGWRRGDNELPARRSRGGLRQVGAARADSCAQMTVSPAHALPGEHDHCHGVCAGRVDRWRRAAARRSAAGNTRERHKRPSSSVPVAR